MPKYNPKVSVIIPSYNRAHIILNCLESVCSQTYSNLEIIIVDDGSKDNTSDVVSQYKDSRIIYVKHEKNQGLPSARNTGIKTSCGEILAFQDTDDLWMPTKIEETVNVFGESSSDVGVVYAASIRYRNNKKTYLPASYIKPKEGDVFKRLLLGNFIPAISACVRRECFDQVGIFDPSLPSLEDWEMWIRLAKKYKFRFIEEPLQTIYYTKDSLTANVSNFLNAEKLILKKHYSDFAKNPPVLAKRYAQIGIYNMLSGNNKQCREYFYKAHAACQNKYIYKTLYWLSAFPGLVFIKACFLFYMNIKRILNKL